MNYAKACLTIALPLSLLACAAPSYEEMANADYGAYPNGYEQIIRSYLGKTLKDPDSLKLNVVRAPTTGWNGFGGRKFGYIVCAEVNAKNSYGGYVGSRLSYFMIKNGVVIQDLVGDGNPLTQGMIEGWCGYR